MGIREIRTAARSPWQFVPISANVDALGVGESELATQRSTHVLFSSRIRYPISVRQGAWRARSGARKPPTGDGQRG
jgi:hypothetical protein